MKQSATDIRLIGGILLAHLFLYITFHDQSIFWYIYTASSLFLISYSIMHEKTDDEISTGKYILYGVLSGVSLYFIFMFGDWFFSKISISLENEIKDAYQFLSPKWIWHYFVLIFILAPGEEIFWRGFVQKRIMRSANGWTAILITAALNASVFIYSGNASLVIAGFVGAIAWGYLYLKLKSTPLVIMSHLVFDLLLIVVVPLH